MPDVATIRVVLPRPQVVRISAFLSGTTTWGNITGTLSSQTDLQSALDAKANKSVGVYTVSNVTPDRAYDANSTSINELADVLGTLITDLKTTGIIS